jgi:hypothetical protein
MERERSGAVNKSLEVKRGEDDTYIQINCRQVDIITDEP